MAAPREGSTLLGSIAGRLERSQHVFLAGLVVAFAVEILVDWNATFYEINVLRATLRDKATHYAAILRLAAEAPVQARDTARLGELSRRLLEDDEVIYIRATDGTGAILSEAGAPLGVRYRKQIGRDVSQMLKDPAEQRRLVAESTHRDILQSITDAEDRAIRLVTGKAPDPPPPSERTVVYQDRLYDEGTRDEDRTVTWALATVEAPGGATSGLVLVALKTDRLRKQIARKLWKGLAVTVFFLGVILVQQLSSRRAKLRMLSLRDALAAARTAIGAALPKAPPTVAGLDGALAFEQAERLGGTIYDFHPAPGPCGAFDVFVALPEGSGIDVAFASVFLRDEQRRLRRELPDPSPEPLLVALAAGYERAPIHRRSALLLFRVDRAACEVRGVAGGVLPPIVLDPAGESILPSLEPLDAALGDQIDGPVRRFRVAFPKGATLLLYTDGLPDEGPHPLPMDEVLRQVRESPANPTAEVVTSLRELTLKRAGGALADDLFVLLLRGA